MRREQCRTCMWYRELRSDVEAGECRFNPPSSLSKFPNEHEQSMGFHPNIPITHEIYPRVNSHEGCNSWKEGKYYE